MRYTNGRGGRRHKVSEKPIDLSGEEEKPRRRQPKIDTRSQRDREGDASSIYTRTDRREREWERDIRVRLERTQARLIEALEGREDFEMAAILKEDGRAMIGGLIYVCGNATWLRSPIITAMTIIEPLLAFGRTFKTLVGRWTARRLRIAEERERAQWEYDAHQEAERQAAEAQVFRHNIVE